jgi:chemotaxis family two-component system response regulator Rcp1
VPNPDIHGPLNLLLVEDNPADARLFSEACKEVRTPMNLQVAGDALQALDMLHRRGSHADARRPDLIFLDLNLPGLSGHELLAQIKATEDLKVIPVVILSSSRSPQDILKSYELSASCYLGKPKNLSDFFDLVKACELFWLDLVQFPPRQPIVN